MEERLPNMTFYYFRLLIEMFVKYTLNPVVVGYLVIENITKKICVSPTL